VRSRAHRVGQLETIHHGHRHVTEDYVRTQVTYELQSLLAILRDVHVVTGRPHRRLDELPDHGIVLAEDDLAHDAASAAAEIRAAPRGSLTWKTEPSPTLLSAQTVPPWSWTIWRTIGRPRPVPRMGRVASHSTPPYRAKSASSGAL